MVSSRSVHDNLIYAYSMDCERQRLTIHTMLQSRDRQEFTDLVYCGVVAHVFDHVLPDNILFDVEEVDPDVIVDRAAETLKDSWRYCWPPIEYNGDMTALKRLLHEQSIRGFEISSSYGLSGWVLARGCEQRVRDAKMEIA